MIKRLLFLLLSLSIILSSCNTTKLIRKKPINDIGLGLLNYRLITNNNFNINPTLSITFHDLYFDLSNNLKFGKGIEYSMMSTTNKILNKRNLGSINIGYNIKLDDNKFIIPTIGYAWAINIYSDNNHPNSYYRQLSKININLSLNYKFYLKNNDKMGIMFGIGNIERIKINIIYRF